MTDVDDLTMMPMQLIYVNLWINEQFFFQETLYSKVTIETYI